MHEKARVLEPRSGDSPSPFGLRRGKQESDVGRGRETGDEGRETGDVALASVPLCKTQSIFREAGIFQSLCSAAMSRNKVISY